MLHAADVDREVGQRRRAREDVSASLGRVGCATDFGVVVPDDGGR